MVTIYSANGQTTRPHVPSPGCCRLSPELQVPCPEARLSSPGARHACPTVSSPAEMLPSLLPIGPSESWTSLKKRIEGKMESCKQKILQLSWAQSVVAELPTVSFPGLCACLTPWSNPWIRRKPCRTCACAWLRTWKKVLRSMQDVSQRPQDCSQSPKGQLSTSSQVPHETMQIANTLLVCKWSRRLPRSVPTSSNAWCSASRESVLNYSGGPLDDYLFRR